MIKNESGKVCKYEETDYSVCGYPERAEEIECDSVVAFPDSCPVLKAYGSIGMFVNQEPIKSHTHEPTKSHARWEALMASGRIRFIGSSSMSETGKSLQVSDRILCVEFHSKSAVTPDDHPYFGHRESALSGETATSKSYLEKFADSTIEEASDVDVPVAQDNPDHVSGSGIDILHGDIRGRYQIPSAVRQDLKVSTNTFQRTKPECGG